MKDHFCHSTTYNVEYVKCKGQNNAKAVTIKSFYVQKYYITINNFKHKY